MKKYGYIFKYIILLIILLFFTVLSTKLSMYIDKRTAASFLIIPKMSVYYFMYIMFGVLLGSESLILHKKYFKYNFSAARFIFLVIPFFILISLLPTTLFVSIPFKVHPLLYNEKFLSLLQIIFGYNLITSFFVIADKPNNIPS